MKKLALTLALLTPLLWSGEAQAATIKLRPQGAELIRAAQTVLAELSTKDIPMTLDTSGGTTLTLGGVGVSAAPFNPDESARIVSVGGERRLEINPQGPVPVLQAVREALQAELGLTAWTPAAAQLRYGGADLSGDRKIDLTDLALLMEDYGKKLSGKSDLNGDGRVDDTDVQLFMAQYRTAFAQPVIPAPVTATPASSAPAQVPAGTSPGQPAPAAPSPAPLPSPSNTPPAAPLLSPPSLAPNPGTTPSPTTPSPAPAKP